MFPPDGGQDRLAVQQFDDRIVLVIADGAGGIGGGAEAAQFACDRAMQLAHASPGNTRDWGDRLLAIDQALSKSENGGQTTLVVAEVWNGKVVGASVGDSEAWLVGNQHESVHLTEHQQRKPLVGSGLASPCPFGPVELSGRRLLIGSDGLFRFARLDQLLGVAQVSVTPRAPSLLSDLARLPNGELPDDVSVIVCEEDADRTAVMREITELLPGAQRGESDACFEVAQRYEALDQEEAAAHWFKTAADAGSTEACYDIGVRYAKGRGVAQDYAQANHYYRIGAQRGCALAISNLGYHYELGDRGLDQDSEQAIDCYRRAAELGATTGQSNLAKAYEHGKFGLAPDACRAAALFRAAARKGDPMAMVMWGNCLEKGIGVPVNYSKAMAQFRRAMAKGSAEAVLHCGLLFEHGRGVERNDRQAVRWYEEAAQHGCIAAQRCLGNMYRRGRGVVADRKRASRWLERAAQAGDADAKAILDYMLTHPDAGDQST